MPSLLLITPPATEPLTLAEAKAHLRVEHADDDALIGSLITAVREACESHIGRALIMQTWRLLLDRDSLCDERSIALPRAPLQQVTAIASLDEAGTATPFSLDNTYIDTAATPGRLLLKDSASWPQLLRRVAGLRIDYTAGYGTATDVPAVLKQGMLQHLAMLYTNRGDSSATLPAATLALYQPYRLIGVA